MKKRIIVLVNGVLFSGLLASAANAGSVSFSYNNGGDYCREYTQDFYVGNRLQTGYGTACLQPDGSWAIRQPAAINAPRQIVRPIVVEPQVVAYPVTYVVRDYHRSYFTPVRSVYRENYYYNKHSHHGWGHGRDEYRGYYRHRD